MARPVSPGDSAVVRGTVLPPGPGDLAAPDALALTGEILGALERLAALPDLIERAYRGRVWIALGYPDWQTYCDKSFGARKIKRPRPERLALVRQLTADGMSTRAIAAVAGVDASTVRADLKSPGAGYPPPAKVTGQDGREYPARSKPAGPLDADGMPARRDFTPAPARPGKHAATAAQDEPEPAGVTLARQCDQAREASGHLLTVMKSAAGIAQRADAVFTDENRAALGATRESIAAALLYLAGMEKAAAAGR
jgi:hypothetical protein